jgi:hypothetical protein
MRARTARILIETNSHNAAEHDTASGGRDWYWNKVPHRDDDAKGLIEGALGGLLQEAAYFFARVSIERPAGRQWFGQASCPRPQLEERAMQYMLLIYGTESAVLAATQETATKMSAAYAAYTEAMSKAGIIVGGNRLRPTSTASSVRVTDGKTQVLDGPYADTKEQLGGYYMIDVPDLDAALSWAARCPGANHGTIEVRPIWPMT